MEEIECQCAECQEKSRAGDRQLEDLELIGNRSGEEAHEDADEEHDGVDELDARLRLVAELQEVRHDVEDVARDGEVADAEEDLADESQIVVTADVPCWEDLAQAVHREGIVLLLLAGLLFLIEVRRLMDEQRGQQHADEGDDTEDDEAEAELAEEHRTDDIEAVVAERHAEAAVRRRGLALVLICRKVQPGNHRGHDEVQRDLADAPADEQHGHAFREGRTDHREHEEEGTADNPRRALAEARMRVVRERARHHVRDGRDDAARRREQREHGDLILSIEFLQERWQEQAQHDDIRSQPACRADDQRRYQALDGNDDFLTHDELPLYSLLLICLI